MRNSLRELRSQRGLSQGELADLLGVSRQTVNAIETGRYNPALPLAIGIARFFRRPVEEIFQLDDPAA
ncbi:putative transcriptional regulator [Kitasatospora gansuensis]|uniref:Putative transcriptional regulator n=1 Tax=Kitasatospora gansuensis TaxID=258050 RepID=A0A7W7SJ72_9ACTN|nr:helix-turn-helix transcriptional regulator [Kitasatospora gansuensis]MBB4950276.1 putative transcriptional regulator [Kitasatospora gansuensis]